MDAETESLEGARRRTLFAAVLAVAAVASVPLTEAAVPVTYAAALIGLWLLVAALVRYVTIRRRQDAPLFRRPIPIRFSGTIGRFRLRVQGDGRRVEVHAGDAVVAQAIATDEQDELVVDLETVDDAELDELGTAIGTAIRLVADADEAREAAARLAPTRTATASGFRPVSGGVLHTIGSRSS